MKIKYTSVRNLITLLAWLYRDALRSHTYNALLFAIFSIIALFLQLVAFIVAARYIRLLETNRTVHFFGKIFHPHSSVELLLLVALIVLVALIGSGALNFFARTMALRLSLIYEDNCSKRVIDIASSLPALGHKILCQMADRAILSRFAGLDSRACGRCLRVLLMAMSPASVMLVVLVGLFWLDWLLTLVLLLILMIGGIGYFQINKAGVRAAYTFEHSNKKLAKARNCLLGHEENHRKSSAKNFQQFGAANREGYFGRILAVERIRFLSQSLAAIVILIIVIFQGIKSIGGGETFLSHLVLFLILARYGMSNFMAFNTQLSSLNGAYPSVKRLHTLFTAYESITDTSPIPGCQGKLTYKDLKGKTRSEHISNLGTIIVLGHGIFNRLQFSPVCAALSGCGAGLWRDRERWITIDSGAEALKHLPHQLKKPYGNFVWIDLGTLDDSATFLENYRQLFTIYFDGGALYGSQLYNFFENSEMLRKGRTLTVQEEEYDEYNDE